MPRIVYPLVCYVPLALAFLFAAFLLGACGPPSPCVANKPCGWCAFTCERWCFEVAKIPPDETSLAWHECTDGCRVACRNISPRGGLPLPVSGDGGNPARADGGLSDAGLVESVRP